MSSCELLLYWDLWNIWNTKTFIRLRVNAVVNCCCIEIFEIFETPPKQTTTPVRSCELLLYWDLWNIWNTRFAWKCPLLRVVNCCCIEIFEIFETPNGIKALPSDSCELLLYWDLWNIWNTWAHLSNHAGGVVNCCCIEIFEIFETPSSDENKISW